MIFQEEAETLTKLGLTCQQAKVYLALTMTGKASIKTIANETKIDRAHVYRVLVKLQEIGLVEKILTKPILFQASSPQETLPTLVERKAKELNEIKIKTNRILHKIKSAETEEKDRPESQFTLISGEQAKHHAFNKVFNRAQKSYDGIFIRQQDFCAYVLTCKEGSVTLNLLSRGVRIRLVICRSEKEQMPKEVLKKIRELNKDNNFVIRYTKSSAAAMYGIVDDKEVFINTGEPCDWHKKASLWSNNPRLVALGKGYFDQMWKTSTAQTEYKVKKKAAAN
ncbi:MAG: hypothetical protein NWF04_00220 [Candidatus Bathyarchaeota archaeon]|nr:hypothetical protein [Candidatus Bathyarchaeota archaeon]